MYIGAIPTPAATESRQEFTATANQTVYNTTGGTVGFCDCYLNGVKLANSDFSFDGADVTLTTGAAAGDTLAVVMRQADNALVALPIKDSAGNNVLSEANNVVSIDSGVQFPAGHVIQVSTNNFNTQPTLASTSFNAFPTAITATINNCTTGNDILIILSIYCSNNTSQYFNFRLVDTTNSNAVIGTEGADGLMGRLQGGGNEIYCFSNSILYTPASFSSGSLTVELYAKADGGTLYLNRNSGSGSNVSSSITLMELQS